MQVSEAGAHEAPPGETTVDFDYVVIGGGSAGCVLAARLSEDPAVRVALLEAGGRNDGLMNILPTGAALHVVRANACNWGFVTVPQPGLDGRSGYQPRGKGLGGSSAINAMVYLRGQREDYDGWAALGAAGWGWDDVLPYFKRAEHNERGASALHGTGGPLNVADLRSPHPFARLFVEAAQQAGIPRNDDFAGATQEGAGLYQVTQKNGERWSVARAYLEPARGRPNLVVLTGVLASRIVFEGRRAVGVRYRHDGAERQVRARREVLLAAGALQSPQLLMLSGVGPARHLHQHGIALVADAPDVGQGHGMSCHACALRPQSRGSVTLADADARTPPVIDPRFLSHPDDLEVMVRGFKLVRSIFAQPAFAPFDGGNPQRELYDAAVRSDDEIRAAIRARADTIYHPAGTCRMGSDPQSVVDPELRVRGVAGLRVVDASVMPTLVSGNTNAPVVMIAEKAVDLIRAARPAVQVVSTESVAV